MKRTSIFSVCMLVVFAGGCRESYTVKTKIHPDGSFEKTIVCEGDSAGFNHFPLPFVLKDGWKFDRQKKSDKTDTLNKSERFITTATKNYGSNEELQAEWARGADSSKLKITSQIEKHFRWFFTYYTYRETIPAIGRFTPRVPFTGAFTPAEIERLKDGKDTVLNKRFDKYWEQAVVDEFIDRLIVASEQLHDTALAPARWEEHRTFIAEWLDHNNVAKPSDLTALFEKLFHTPSVRNLSVAVDSSMNIVAAKMKIEGDLDVPYQNEVVMPGILIASNSTDVEGAKLAWKCRPHRALDVVMTAESRMVNLWAVIASAIVSLALLVGLIVPLVRVKLRTAYRMSLSD